MLLVISKKLISLLLILSFILALALSLTACNKSDDGHGDSNAEGNPPNEDDDSAGAGRDDYKNKLVVPEYKEYDRSTVNFKDITYTRPNFELVLGKVDDIILEIEKNEISFEDQIAKIEAFEPDYNNVRGMYAFSNIYNSKDSSVSYWNEEYSYVSTNYPKFVEKLEDMFVAAANSPHAERFESDYFGDGLIDQYKDGGNYTETMIALWSEEEALEADYSNTSTANTKVTYRDKTDTVDNILAFYRDKYGKNSQEYTLALAFCMDKYEEVTAEKAGLLLVELFKVRKEIANELGYESYIEHAYEGFGRDYSHDDMRRLLDDIADYALPVYAVLNNYIFQNYFKMNAASKLTLDKLINNSYFMLKDLDAELFDIFSYMLQFDLFDIELSSANRQSGAFTTYIDNYDAPFIFMTALGLSSDYSTLFHEFGHFAEEYMSFGSSSSLDAKEVSSQGLEYIMLHHLGSNVSEKDKQFLKYTALANALEILIFQGFYAKFEDIAYKLAYSEISKESLDRAVLSAAADFSLNTEVINDISAVNIPHIYLYPMYVQSYCTSILPSLELYFMEGEEALSGLKAYKSVLDLSDDELGFVEMLNRTGLTSPFDNGVIRMITDKIYFEIVGTHYYKQETSNGNSNAA